MLWFRRKKRTALIPLPFEHPFVSYGRWGDWLVAMEISGQYTIMTWDEAERLGADLIAYSRVVKLLQQKRHDEAAATSAQYSGLKNLKVEGLTALLPLLK